MRGAVAEHLAVLGAELRTARLRAGLTQEDVAHRAAVSRQLVSRIESGHPTGEIAAVVAVAAALGHRLAAVPPSPPNTGEQAAHDLIQRLREHPEEFTRDIADAPRRP